MRRPKKESRGPGGESRQVFVVEGILVGGVDEVERRGTAVRRGPTPSW